MAIHDERFPLTGEELAEIERHREAMRLLPLAMAATDDEQTRALRNAAICARVRGRYEGEAVIDPGDEQLSECVGCNRKDAEIRAHGAAIHALRERLEDQTGLYLNAEADRRKLEKAMAKAAARERRREWAGYVLAFIVALVVGVLAGARL